MGQDSNELLQEQSVVGMQNLVDVTGNSSIASEADFGGYEPFVDEHVIARFLFNLTPRRVLEMARDREIPAHPLGRGSRKTWRFRVSEVDAHFSAKENSTGARLKSAVSGATRRKQ